MSEVEYADYPIPLPGYERFLWVRMPRTITEAEWTYLANLFAVAKPGIVYDPPPPVSLVKIRSVRGGHATA